MDHQTEPTLEQYALAFRQRARPHRGPATLEAALEDPVYRICLRQMALQLGRPRWQPAQVAAGLPVGPGLPPTPTQARVPPKTRSTPMFAGGGLGCWPKSNGVDRKRAAANDRDD